MTAITLFGECQEEPEGPFLLRVARLRREVDPYRDDCWGHGPISREAVADAIAGRRFALSPNEHWCGRNEPAYRDRPLDYDVERIARLVVAPASDAVCIEVTSPCGSFQFLDGNHRLGAAIFRRDLWILTGFGGYVDAFHERFPEALRQPKAPTRVYGAGTVRGPLPSAIGSGSLPAARNANLGPRSS